MEQRESGLNITMKLAHSRLNNWEGKKLRPLCLNCGEKATNELPSCSNPKCIRIVRPIYRWAVRVAKWATTKAVKPAKATL
jgi:hypothetical protein